MKNLFKYAAVHWKSLLAIIAVLFIQAYCDLSLPAYTSDIVNVGIQQGGIEDQVPEALSADEMEKLLLFVPEEDRETVLDAYETDSSTYDTDAYVLRESAVENEEQMDALSDILSGPMMLTAGFESGSDMTEQIEAQLKENIPAQMVSDDMTVFDILKMMPEQQRDALIEEMEKQMGDLPDTILDQAAVSYVRRQSAMWGLLMKPWAWTWTGSRSGISSLPVVRWWRWHSSGWRRACWWASWRPASGRRRAVT